MRAHSTIAALARTVVLFTVAGGSSAALLASPARAQVTAIAAGATVGAVLDKLGDEVSQLIDQARNAGNALQMEAGREVYLAIQNAQNAYSKSMNQTMDRVDTSISSAINQLHSMADDVQQRTFGSLDVLTRRAQTIVNSLPFRAHEPQVSAIRPRYVAPASSTAPVVIRFAGNFEFASREGFTPTLLVGQTQVPLTSNTTQDLTFGIPGAGLGQSVGTQVRFVGAVLTVPWQETRLLLFHTRHEDVFRALVGVLPASLGRILVTHYTSHDSVITKRFTSTSYQVCSIKECGNDDHKDVPFAVAPDSGWSIARNTSSFDKSWNEGDNSNSFISDDGGQVRYNVTTIHHGALGGQSGKVIFTISFNELKHQTIQDSTVTILNDGTAVDLHWGERRTFSFTSGSYLVRLAAFDGSLAEFRGPDSSNRFLTVREEGGQLVLVAADPAALNWP